jgi:hypothetical protein
VVQATFNDTGIPTREGIANIIRAIKAEGRFVDRNIAYEEVAEPRFAIEVAKELGTRCREKERVVGVKECWSDGYSDKAILQYSITPICFDETAQFPTGANSSLRDGRFGI